MDGAHIDLNNVFFDEIVNFKPPHPSLPEMDIDKKLSRLTFTPDAHNERTFRLEYGLKVVHTEILEIITKGQINDNRI